nr:hypothetical protein [Tanacetum cinerariifolium]
MVNTRSTNVGVLTNPVPLETQIANLTSIVSQLTQSIQALGNRNNKGDVGSLMANNSDNDVSLGKSTWKNENISHGENDAYKMFDEMSSIKFCTVREYYDAFISFSRKVGWSGMCAISIFISRLQPPIRKKVSSLNPKTLYDAYCWASMKEANIKLLMESCGKNVDYEYVVVDASDCVKNKGIQIITTIEKNVVKQDIGKKEDSNFSISVNNSEISVVNKADENGEEEDCNIEEIESNGMTDITDGRIGECRKLHGNHCESISEMKLVFKGSIWSLLEENGLNVPIDDKKDGVTKSIGPFSGNGGYGFAFFANKNMNSLYPLIMVVKSAEDSVLDSVCKKTKVIDKVIKCFGKEIATNKNQMVINLLLEFASNIHRVHDISDTRLREVDDKFGDMELEKRIKLVKKSYWGRELLYFSPETMISGVQKLLVDSWVFDCIVVVGEFQPEIKCGHELEVELMVIDKEFLDYQSSRPVLTMKLVENRLIQVLLLTVTSVLKPILEVKNPLRVMVYEFENDGFIVNDLEDDEEVRPHIDDEKQKKRMKKRSVKSGKKKRKRKQLWLENIIVDKAARCFKLIVRAEEPTTPPAAAEAEPKKKVAPKPPPIGPKRDELR